MTEPSIGRKGISSMQEVEALLDELARRKVELWEEAGNLRYRAPADALTAEMRKCLVEWRDPLLTRLRHGGATDQHISYPLTDLQYAYWLAEQQDDGGTPGYWFEEYCAKTLDVERLELAWQRMIERHEALRVVFDKDGRQRILAEHGAFRVQQEDLRGLNPDVVDARVSEARRRHSNPTGTLQDWPLLRLFAQRLDDRWHIYVGGRFLVMDGLAWDQLCTELAAVYENPDTQLQSMQQSFAGAIIEDAAVRNDVEYRASLNWWLEQELPGPPELPLARGFDPSEPRRFSRLRETIAPREGRQLRERAARHGLTLNNVLCAAYAETLGHWTSRPRFALNLLLSNPRHLRGGGRWPLSNAATTCLLVVDLRRHTSFVERSRALRDRLALGLPHAKVSGIAVARELARRSGTAPVPYPVVFASTLGMAGSASYGLGRLGWEALDSYVQTPHVLLDLQAFERGDALSLNWDFVSAAFEPGLMKDMFHAYCGLLRRLTVNDEAYRATCPVSTPSSQLLVRPSTLTPLKPARLDAFVYAAQAWSGDAVVDAAGRLSYAELIRRAAGVCEALKQRGVGRGHTVPVCVPKGRGQIIAALGVLLSGAAYVPIEVSTPRIRRDDLLSQLTPQVVLYAPPLAQPSETELEWLNIDQVAAVELSMGRGGSPEDLAYVIFTSGSTGSPKGVAITHQAARNTIDDVLRRWPLSAQDAVLSVSQFSFDLSVFDMFGLLALGGRVVVPGEEDRRDPACWCRFILSHRVTVWNSAPALMEILVDYAELHQVELPFTLVLLSGDWIPKSLPARIRAVARSAKVIALGGATEASIWSNYFDTEDVDPSWPSVPYGYPLTGQRLHVLDDLLQERPDYCEGDLYIAGHGLALGYWRDEERTASSFVHDSDGRRIYRTGDRARYWPGGIIEFLGRRDQQVKIRGHRVELGEIEAALQTFPGVRSAAAVLVGPGRLLCACVVATFQVEEKSDELKRHLTQRLPEYMLPSTVVNVPHIPLSSNGKVHKAALLPWLERRPTTERKPLPELTKTESQVFTAWCSVLGHADFDPGSNFFEAGGDSVAVARLINHLERQCGKRLSMATIMEAPTIERIASVLRELSTSDGSNLLHRFSELATDHVVCLIHPVGGTLFGYRSLVEMLRHEVRIVGVSAAGTVHATPDETVECMAQRYLDLLGDEFSSRRQPVLVGWSFGGVVGLEMARRLRSAGRRASIVAVDPWVRGVQPMDLPYNRLREDFMAISGMNTAESNVEGELGLGLDRLLRVYMANCRALQAYVPNAQIECDVLVATREPQRPFTGLQPLMGSTECQLKANVHHVDADHFDIMLPPKVSSIVEVIRAHLRRLP